MAEYVIFADSSVDLPLEEINRYGLQIVNLHLFIGGNEENIDTLDSHTFYQRLRAGEVASTSAPSIEEYAEKMRPVLDEGKDILYLGFSEGLSCSYNNGKLAIEELAEQYPENVDVAVYFLDVAKEGICQHYATAATMMYRAFGIPARFTTGFAVPITDGSVTEVSSLNAHAWVEIFLNGIGWVPVEVTGSSFDDFPLDNGKQNVVISAYSASKEYDGNPFGEWTHDVCNILKGSLLPGHTMTVTIYEEGRYNSLPGKYLTKITKVVIRDENGKDVTSSYNVIAKDGSMVIEKRKLTVQIGSATKAYDGTPLTSDKWWIVNGSLLPDHQLNITITSKIDKIGILPNKASDAKVYQNSKNISSYYDITILPGTLEITSE